MITRINLLKQIGKFTDFLWKDEVPDFSKINLIFGYNGSGKTIMSNVLRLYSAQREDEEDSLFKGISNSSGEARVEITMDSKCIPYSADCKKTNIYVFNTDFVAEHVYEGSRLNCKRFDSKGITEEQLKNPKIEKMEKELQKLNEDLSKKWNGKADIDNEFKRIKKDISQEFNKKIPGSRLEIPFPSVAPEDSEETIRGKLNKSYESYELSQKQEELKKDIDLLEALSFVDITTDFDRIKDIISKSILQESQEKIQKKLSDLQDFKPKNTTASQWFEDGYMLLKHTSEKTEKKCPLCDTNIEDRIFAILADYQAFFSEEYNLLTNNIDRMIETVGRDLGALQTNQEVLGALNSIEIKYPSFLQPRDDTTGLGEEKPRDVLANIGKQLSAKRGNVEEAIWNIDDDSKKVISDYNSQVSYFRQRQDELVSKLKSISLDPDILIHDIKNLSRDYAHAKINAFGDGDKVRKYHAIEKYLQDIEKNIQEKENEKIREIAKLRDESLYINNYLIQLGVLHFAIDMGKEGIEDNIKINFVGGITKNRLKYCLSESEKTTLAFAYFMSKIQYEVIDNSNASLENTIIIIDDPISSLDENRLHTTASLICSTFENAEQLFIFSHNLIFMKFLSNVLSHVKIDDRRDYYLCNYKCDLIKLPKQLTNYRTTYFIKVNDIYAYYKSNISYEEVKNFLPNYIRTVLETFLSFKFSILKEGNSGQRYRSPGLKRLIRILEGRKGDFSLFKKVEDIDYVTLIPKLETIKRITDPQSHGSPQDVDDVCYISEHELKGIARDALNIIAFLDQIHLKEIVND